MEKENSKSMYSIRELEQLSGIKAHTIRVWERRYGILKPHRTDTNIRLYDDDQLIKLLNVSTLLNGNWKISKVSKLSAKEIREEVKKLVVVAGSSDDIHVTELLRYALDFDEVGFEKILSYNMMDKGVKTTFLQIVYPFLQRVGLMWRTNSMNPAQEHFASNIIRRKLIAAIDNIPKPEYSPSTFLLYLPEKEHHEIGLLLANFLIRSAGIKTIYLGCNVPFENVVKTAEILDIDFVLSFFVTPRQEGFHTDYLQRLSDTFKDQEILVAGRVLHDMHPNFPKNVRYLIDIPDLEHVLQENMNRPSSSREY